MYLDLSIIEGSPRGVSKLFVSLGKGIGGKTSCNLKSLFSFVFINTELSLFQLFTSYSPGERDCTPGIKYLAKSISLCLIP